MLRVHCSRNWYALRQKRRHHFLVRHFLEIPRFFQAQLTRAMVLAFTSPKKHFRSILNYFLLRLSLSHYLLIHKVVQIILLLIS